MQKKTLAVCAECREAIHDGNTAYHLHDSWYCPACIAAARVICRPHHTRRTPPHDRYTTDKAGIRHQTWIEPRKDDPD